MKSVKVKVTETFADRGITFDGSPSKTILFPLLFVCVYYVYDDDDDDVNNNKSANTAACEWTLTQFATNIATNAHTDVIDSVTSLCEQMSPSTKRNVCKAVKIKSLAVYLWTHSWNVVIITLTKRIRDSVDRVARSLSPQVYRYTYR